MYRIDNATAAAVMPTPMTPGPNPNGFFTIGIPGTTNATIVDADWMNAVQEELCTVITGAGLALSKNTRSQLQAAIEEMIGMETTRAEGVESYIEAQIRIKLTANQSFYVSNGGSDTTGDGSSSAPWATLQQAWNTIIAGYDCNGFQITVNVADGTYAPLVASGSVLGSGTVLFQGDIASPSNCTISATNASCFLVDNNATIQVAGFRLVATGTSILAGVGLFVRLGGQLNIAGDMQFGSCAVAHIACNGGGEVTATGVEWTIGSPAPSHISCSQGFINLQTVTINISSAMAFGSAFCAVTSMGFVQIQAGSSFIGSAATGTKYTIALNSVINTGGSGASFFPGSVAGTTSTGGQYA
jgi:hypothetical protein